MLMLFIGWDLFALFSLSENIKEVSDLSERGLPRSEDNIPKAFGIGAFKDFIFY
jgi:hypothetical protein